MILFASSSMMFLYIAVVVIMLVRSSGSSLSTESTTVASAPPQPGSTITYLTGSRSSYSTTPVTSLGTVDTSSSDRTTEFTPSYKETTTLETTIWDGKEFSGSGSGDTSETSTNVDNVTILEGDEAILQEECSIIDCKQAVIQKVFSSYINYSFQWESKYHQMVNELECARLCSRAVECIGFHYQHQQQQQRCALIIA